MDPYFPWSVLLYKIDSYNTFWNTHILDKTTGFYAMRNTMGRRRQVIELGILLMVLHDSLAGKKSIDVQTVFTTKGHYCQEYSSYNGYRILQIRGLVVYGCEIKRNKASETLSKTSLFTRWQDVHQQNLKILQTRNFWVYQIAMKYNRHIQGNAANTAVKFQKAWQISLYFKYILIFAKRPRFD